MKYNVHKDLLLIRQFFDLKQSKMSELLDVDRTTIARIENEILYPSDELIDRIYNYAFSNNLNLNIQKEMFYRDELNKKHILLVHASKDELIGDIDVHYGRNNNDFGYGFYCGEAYDKSSTFVCRFDHPSIYFIDFNPENLNKLEFEVDTRWMLTIAYFRGRLNKYKNSNIVKSIASQFKDIDYVIAPIADNRMFQIIDTFINGDITDEQARYSLSATNLGKQYVFISPKSIKHLNILERCYLCSKEKEYYQKEQLKFLSIGQDKVKLAKINYKNKGKYIEEIINEDNK
jgi:transcriptional regulator with XRE-family HTH domain